MKTFNAFLTIRHFLTGVKPETELKFDCLHVDLYAWWYGNHYPIPRRRSI